MVDTEIILAKASSVQKHLLRIESKVNVGIDHFLINADMQDILLFNMQMAIQSCIDIAAHIISAQAFGVPGSHSEMFYILEDNSIIDRDMAEKMVHAIGFRNLIAHEYARIDLHKVFHIAQNDIKDLNRFIQQVLSAYRTSA